MLFAVFYKLSLNLFQNFLLLYKIRLIYGLLHYGWILWYIFRDFCLNFIALNRFIWMRDVLLRCICLRIVHTISWILTLIHQVHSIRPISLTLTYIVLIILLAFVGCPWSLISLSHRRVSEACNRRIFGFSL